jgi:hypothetical protein
MDLGLQLVWFQLPGQQFHQSSGGILIAGVGPAS